MKIGKMMKMKDKKQREAGLLGDALSDTTAKGQEAITTLILTALREKQVKFVFVEGNAEREAIFRQEGDSLLIYVLYHPDEVKGRLKVKVGMPNSSQIKAVERILRALNGQVEARRKGELLEEMVLAKKSGKTVEIPQINADSVENLIEQSLTIVEAAKKVRK